MSKVKCYYCKRYGHFATKCLKRQAYVRKQFEHILEEFEDSEKPVFMTCNMTQECLNDIWFLDRSCNDHMTGNKDFFPI